MFDLKRADGVGGGQIQAVAQCRAEFEALVGTLVERLGIAQPGPTSRDRSRLF